MSMFDYDARPVTPGVVLVGTSASRGGYAIRDFLSRNGYPFEWVDAGRPEAVRAVLGVAGVEPSALPLCILPGGSRLAPATVERVAAGLGMVAAPSRPGYDLVIVGAGPAGLAAAVNAASEGLRTVMVEAVAPGGQAGTTSMIENLLGFPGRHQRQRAGGPGGGAGAPVRRRNCCWPGRWPGCRPTGRAMSPGCPTARWCAGGRCCSPAE
jgi:NADPH-dependent 2,4-dienoyl-CoA reductase/sulfur reductase-like enzyme